MNNSNSIRVINNILQSKYVVCMCDKKQRVNDFNKYVTHMTLWEQMQRCGIEQIQCQNDIRKIAMKKIASTWKKLLIENPEFLDLHEEKKYFEMIFNPERLSHSYKNSPYYKNKKIS